MENHTNSYDMVIIGNYTKDTIVSVSGTRLVDGGGFNYGAHVAAMMGLNVATVTRLAKEDSHVVDALKRLGVDVFVTFTLESTHLRLEYPTSNVDERILTVTKTAGSFTPAEVKGLNAKAFLLNASTRGEVGLDVIQLIKKKDTLVAADVQGFVRIIESNGRLAYKEWPEKQEVLSYIDVLKTDAVEAKALTGETDIKLAARMIADLGPKEVVLTHRNGMLVFVKGKFYEATFFPKNLVGRSGRGDTCIASYVAKRLTASPKDATIWAAAVTSLKLEAEGPIRRGVSEVEELIKRKYRNAIF